MRIWIPIVIGVVLELTFGPAAGAREGTGSTNFHPEPRAVINKMTYEQAYDRGMDFRLKSMWNECAPYMLRAVELRPDDCNATNRLAECYLQTLQLSLAEKRIETLEAHCQGKSAVHFLHFLLYWLQKRHLEAFEYAYKIYRMGPVEKADAESWMLDGQYPCFAKEISWKYRKAGQPAKGERMAFLLQQISPKLLDKEFLAQFLLAQGRPEDALKALPPPADVLTGKHSVTEAVGLLDIYLQVRDPRTFAVLQALNARYPSNPFVINSMINCSQRMDDPAMLRKAWPSAIKFVQVHPEDYGLVMQGLRWGVASHRRRFTVELARDLAAALPDGPSACHIRAVMYQTKNHPDEALAEYARALKLNPKADDILMDRGVLYTRLYMAEEAIKDFTAAIALKPDNSYYYQLRGECYRNLLTDVESARADFARSKQLREKEVNRSK